MIVKFSTPFTGQLGSGELNIQLGNTVTLRQLLKMLVRRCAGFKEFITQEEPDRDYRYSFICIRKGRIMDLGDRVYDDDVIDIIPPIMGG